MWNCSKYDSDVNEESDTNRTGQSEKKRDDPMVDLFPDDDHEDNRNNKCKIFFRYYCLVEKLGLKRRTIDVVFPLSKYVYNPYSIIIILKVDQIFRF